MDPLVTAALLSTTLGALTTLGSTWLRGRARRQVAREQTLRNQLRHLPSGSRLLHLGQGGMVIEIGNHVNQISARETRPKARPVNDR